MFFEKFPLFVTTQNGKQIVLTDILRRVAVNERYRRLTPFLIPYLVEDGERPEHVSQKFYNTPHYHWVVLAVNRIIDPRLEWPLPAKKVGEVLYWKYDFGITIEDESDFSVGDVVLSSAGGRFVVTDILDGVVYMRSTVGETFIATTDTLINETTETEDIVVLGVEDPTEVVHHWEDALGNWVDGGTVGARPVTALLYEYAENDNKRAKLILDPDYALQFIREFENEIAQ